MLTAIFTILISLSLLSSQKAISSATFNDLNSNSKANGCQVQEFMNICKSIASGLVSNINDTFAKESKDNINSPSSLLYEQSEIYKELKLTKSKKELEGYMIAVAYNSAIVGIVIMFEPYNFTKDRESYALYFKSNGSEIEVSDVGPYAEFSANEYYKIAVGKTDIVFTKPYIYRDV